MFKNAIIYRIAREKPLPDAESLQSAIESLTFIPCGPTQQASAGFVPPRGQDHGALVEYVGNQTILRICTETKSVPAAELARQLDERAKAIEDQTGRKPGKKQRRNLKEELTLELLPRAFPKRSSVGVWIDPYANLLVIDASSASRADDAATLVARLLGESYSLTLLQTAAAPEFAMGHWIVDRQAPEPFSLDRECELRSDDEAKSVVKFAHYPIDSIEVSERVQAGLSPAKVAMSWKGRVSFTLTDTLAIKRIQLDDSVIGSAKEREDGFDADVAIFTGQMTELLRDLQQALGGTDE